MDGGSPVPFDNITETAVSSEMQLQNSGVFPSSSGFHFYQWAGQEGKEQTCTVASGWLNTMLLYVSQ